MKKFNIGSDFKTMLSDIYLMTWRNVLRYIRLPRLLFFSTIQPIMFVLLFRYVFGGAIKVPGIDYVDYLIPGVLVQAVVFGSVQTGVGLADDLSKGIIDRFHSLPMNRAAVLAGRTISDMLRNVFVVILMIAVGYLVGFEFQTNILKILLAFVLLIFFGHAFSWISANIGLLVKEAETAQVAGFVWVFPLVFASSIFVPIETMPDWLRIFAEVSPISVTVDTVRALSIGGDFLGSLWKSLLWITIILIIFIPLAINQYNKEK